jgi:hypothetical protein
VKVEEEARRGHIRTEVNKRLMGSADAVDMGCQGKKEVG